MPSGVPANATPKEVEEFRARFNNWYQRFRRRLQFSIRRRTSVGQKLPTGHEGMAWATLTKLRKALVERAGEIYAERNPSAPGESPIKGEDLTSEQLESVAAEVFEELGNMDQTPIQTRCRSRKLSRIVAQKTLVSAPQVRVRSILLFRV